MTKEKTETVEKEGTVIVIPRLLGKLRKNLLKEGFNPNEAYELVTLYLTKIQANDLTG